ncbi:hypothetical protein [Mesorhizobium sp. M0843]|uniref:hypothetical protein n=1 Tax=Mesorhizobium sp. M0843 TaxID=2957010 RepID=UPI00333634A7
MRFQKQRYNTADPDLGDCFRTSIAVILELDRDDVPLFPASDGPGQSAAAAEWLRERGFDIMETWFEAASPAEAFGTMHKWLGDEYPYVLYGATSQNTCHAVVGCGAEMVWDPSHYDATIVGPMPGCDFYGGAAVWCESLTEKGTKR